ncbi:hypothetical protein AKJ16_DCAP22961, partial [Drosera capensis]
SSSSIEIWVAIFPHKSDSWKLIQDLFLSREGRGFLRLDFGCSAHGCPFLALIWLGGENFSIDREADSSSCGDSHKGGEQWTRFEGKKLTFHFCCVDDVEMEEFERFNLDLDDDDLLDE